MTLDEHLAALAAAPDAVALEAAFQAAIADFPMFRRRGWQLVRSRLAIRIDEAMRQRGRALCDTHPHGHLIPRIGPRRLLTCCGESYRVGYGGNSTGERYCWHAAKGWAVGLMKRAGLSQRAAYSVWDSWSDYPHRALQAAERGLAGRNPDPVLNVLLRSDYPGTRPISLTVKANAKATYDKRASRPCPSCGGTLFDWGGGCSDGFDYINWRCNGCTDVFTEYMTYQQFCDLRQQPRALAT